MNIHDDNNNNVMILGKHVMCVWASRVFKYLQNGNKASSLVSYNFSEKSTSTFRLMHLTPVRVQVTVLPLGGGGTQGASTRAWNEPQHARLG